MRSRFKPWAADLIDTHPEIVIPDPEQQKGKWQEVFGNKNPLHIEAGTGKGRFIIGMAKANPDINYIGIELFDSVIVTALETIREEENGVPNLRLLKVNAKKIADYFEKGEVD